MCVYPFVRSYDWYLLPDDERRQMLADHGRKGSEYHQVLSNTVASFALDLLANISVVVNVHEEGTHAVTMFTGELSPPRERGRMWSSVSSH